MKFYGLGEKLPKVSVIVINHNGEKFIYNCLKSIFANICDKEIIVVDNGSTDQSLHYLRSQEAFIKLIENKTGLGPAVARNQGAAIATGDYLAFFDNDTILHKDCLDEMVKGLSAWKADMCQAKILRIGTNIFDCAGDNIGQFGFLVERASGIEDIGQFDYIVSIVSAKTAACMVTRSAFPGFDESYFMYLEDTDLSWRICNKWQKVIFVPKAVVWHAFNTPFKDFKSNYDLRTIRYNGCRNYIWTIAKNSDGLLFKHVLCWFAIAFMFLCKGKFKDAKYILQGIYDGLRKLPKRQGNWKAWIVKKPLAYYFKKTKGYTGG
jgi:GT2 family glycosyltransferase